MTQPLHDPKSPPSSGAMPSALMPFELRGLPLPEPSAGAEAYRAERERALAFSERRRANYEKFLRAARQSAAVEYLPIKLDIENVSRCNFRCTMCVLSDWPHGRRGRDMTFEEFKGILDEQYGLVEIKLQGIGEPLIQGEPFFQMIEYARAQHIWVRTTTNGSLLHHRDNYRRLVDADANEIQISVDGADKPTMEAIRRGSKFEIVVDNCRLINGYCRHKGVVRTKMWTVVQKGNVAQLEAFVELAARVGFTNQVFSLELVDWGSAERRRRNGEISVEGRVATERLLALIDQGERLGVKVAFWSAQDKYDPASRETLCPWPFERAYVSSDLRTVPCCMIGDPDAFELGKGKGFLETWQGKEYEAFRAAHLRGDIPAVCRGCYRKQEHHG